MSGRIIRQRRTFAVTACLLWLLGVEVLPNLHLASHDDHHTHAADGTIVHVSFGEHSHAHADGTVHADHDHDRTQRHETNDQLAIDAPSGHAAAGIAHHAIALHDPPPPVLAPIAIDRLTWQIEHAPTDHLVATTALRPSARGPPADRLTSITP